VHISLELLRTIILIVWQVFVVQLRFSHSPLQVSQTAQVPVVIFVHSWHSLSSLYSMLLLFHTREKGFAISENSKSVSQLGVISPLLFVVKFISAEKF